jgi:single-strand DNA-binding protein
MRDISVVVLTGRLTKDSALRYTKGGTPIASFSLAVNRSVKHGDAWEDEASFFDIDFWGKAAEAVNRYLVKGQQVGVEGELRQDRWGQDGQSRSKVVVNATNVRLLGGQGSTQTGRGVAQDGQGRQNAMAGQEGGTAGDSFDDDIPF